MRFLSIIVVSFFATIAAVSGRRIGSDLRDLMISFAWQIAVASQQFFAPIVTEVYPINRNLHKRTSFCIFGIGVSSTRLSYSAGGYILGIADEIF